MDTIIRNILEKHNLKYVKYLRRSDGGAARSTIMVVKHGNQKFSLKIFDSEDEDAKVRFINEIKYIKELKKSLSNGYKNWVPQLKWYSTKGENPYYIYHYVNGEPIGRFINDYGITWGQFHESNFPKFIGFLDAVSQTKIDDLHISSWGARSARKELQYYFENVDGLLPFNIYDQVKTFYDRYHNKAFRKAVLSHRDLYPENIILQESNSKDFKFIDWEYLSYVPYGFDAAFMYLMFWREEFWKAKVFSYYYNKYENTGNKKDLQIFIASFKFCLVILSIRFLYQIHTFGDKESEFYSDAKASFLYDLQTALTGELVKPSNIKFYVDIGDIRKVASEYSIKGVKGYEIFYASKGNTVARVDTDSESYIFRFYSQSRSSRLVSRELRIFDLLGKNGVKTYNLHHTINDDLFLSYKLYGRKRKVAVFSYIQGRKLKKYWANETAIIEAATTLKQVHDCNVIHGDYSKENVLFIRNHISGVIDFEWGRITKSRVAKKNDLAKAITLWLVDIRSKKLEDPEFVRVFLRGYYGRDISQQKLDNMCEMIIDKIEAERDIFLTTLDLTRTSRKTQRYDHAINQVKTLMSYDTEQHIS